MNRFWANWRGSQSGMPSWLGAILAVAAMVLMINALPMIASAITPDRSSFAPTADSPPEPIPLPGRAAGEAAAGTAQSAQGQSDPAAPQAPRKPLPVSGGQAVPTLVLGGVLLAGGLGLLMMVGFTGAGPWPGRYVRRIG